MKLDNRTEDVPAWLSSVKKSRGNPLMLKSLSSPEKEYRHSLMSTSDSVVEMTMSNAPRLKSPRFFVLSISVSVNMTYIALATHPAFGILKHLLFS